MKFNELLNRKEILKSLEENNYVSPTKIQEQIMPFILDGKDVLGQSQTGTGKTLAFSGPILDKIEENGKTQTLILAPTRELAIQIASDIEKYAKYIDINITCVYGSSSIEEQIKKLNKGSEIVIGTPGRVKDLIKRKKIKLSEINFFVLDEADEMLSMGFQEEIEFIFGSIESQKQVLLFSATMPKKILEIAKKYMNPDYKTVTVSSTTKIADNITQNYYVINNSYRLEALARILDYYNFHKAIIFVRTKKNADELLESLAQKGYNASAIHGDITQDQRIKTLKLFKQGLFNYLIATDVAARGIHVDNVESVINYNLPESDESYIHRIGRTGRVNNLGLSITFVSEREESIIKDLEKHTKSIINKCYLPKKEEIITKKSETLINDLEEMKKIDNNKFDDYLKSLNEQEKNNVITNLLEQKLMTNIGSDFNVDTEVKNTKKKNIKKRELGDSIRVFVTIGKIDGISKKDFLDFIEKKANLKQGTCTGVEILTKFTFMNIKKDAYDQLFKNCNNIKYKNRIIRIEKAKS